MRSRLLNRKDVLIGGSEKFSRYLTGGTDENCRETSLGSAGFLDRYLKPEPSKHVAGLLSPLNREDRSLQCFVSSFVMSAAC
jgi:hypothetical protein